MDADPRTLERRGDNMSYIVPRDKPKRCTQPKCRFMDKDTLDCRLQGKSWESFEEQYEHCPLIEVPTPHGRLGDLDALYEEISNGNKAYNGIEGYDGEYPNIGNVDDCLDAIKYAGTVIEAEE